MKYIGVSLLVLAGIASSGCSVFKDKYAVKENHFRFENYKKDSFDQIERAFLTCQDHKPTKKFEPRIFEVGQHNLWVTATVSKDSLKNQTKEAFVNFDVTLESGKSYELDGNVIGNKISLWIKDSSTDEAVSEVITTNLERPSVDNYKKRLEWCKSGTV